MKRIPEQINPFFVEIIFVILFFTISATATLQLCVAANNRAKQSSDLSVAVIQAENIAEQVLTLTSPDELPPALKDARQSGGKYTIDYDKNWNPTKVDPRYEVGVILKKTDSAGGTLVRADIAVNRRQNGDSRKIYSLHSEKYLPRGTGGAV